MPGWRTACVVAIIVSAFPACSGGDTEATDPPAGDVVLRIVQGGDVMADWTLDELEAAVPFIELEVDGDAQSGPRLLDVLAASEISDWATAEVRGLGEGRVLEVALPISAGEIDDDWVLDVTKQGTLKLASPDLPRDQWVRDVGEIEFP